MTEIQQNRWDRLVRRVAGIVGGGSQVNDTLNELFPTIDVENVPIELLALAQTDVGMCSSVLTALAANRNHHQLFNPAGSGTLLVVTTVAVDNSITDIIRFSTFIAALTTLAGNERRRDTRAGTTAELVGQNRTDQSAVAGGLDFRFRVVAQIGTFVHDPDGIAVLFPGTGLTVTPTSVNSTSNVAFMWRERVFEPSEVVS